jgi:DNA-binding SARP family transcriptional activator
VSGTHSALRIQLLGEFCVWVGGRRIEDAEWRLRKAKSLVKLLALAPARRLHREQVMDALWPDLDPDAAANNLHKTLHIARRALEPELAPAQPSAYLHLEDDLVALRPSNPLVEIDVESFEGALDAARNSSDAAAYERAVATYRGDLLPEDRYEEWAEERRRELAAGLLDALDALAQLYERDGKVDEAIATLRRVIAREPTHEAAHRAVMRLHAVAGQRHHALRQYQRLREILRRELDVDPEQETEQLYLDILAGSLGSGRRADSGRRPVRPIPRLEEGPAAPLVGRDEEVERLEDLLDEVFSGQGRLTGCSRTSSPGPATTCLDPHSLCSR